MGDWSRKGLNHVNVRGLVAELPAEIEAQETNLVLQRRAKIHLEAAIASLLHCYTTADVAAMLRDSADQLEQFG